MASNVMEVGVIPFKGKFQSLWRVVSPPGWCRCMSALSFLARSVDG
jgi:hypothetical protein